jgi:hypothetical protein
LPLGVALLLADLWPVVSRITPRIDASFFEEKPAVAALIERSLGDRFRLFPPPQWGPTREPVQRIQRAGGAVYWILRNGLHAQWPSLYGIATVMDEDVDKTSLLATAHFKAALQAAERSGREDFWRPFAAMSNVRIRGTFRDLRAAAAQARGDLHSLEPVEFQHVAEFPRYYFADQIVAIHHEREFRERLAAGGTSDAVAFVPIPAFPPARGLVHRWRETANTATIDAESFGQAFLVMSVTPHKYWTVKIDGRRAAPILTNLGYQGIVIPAGRHRIEMRYRNPLIARSAVVSTLAVLLAVLAIVRQPGHSPARRSTRISAP